LRRDEAYTGVLIDDLVTRGTLEPYRMFTSRAEYRLQLREDNVFERLGEYSRRLGLLSAVELRRLERVSARRMAVLDELPRHKAPWQGKSNTLLNLLKMPEIDFARLEELYGASLLPGHTADDAAFIEAHVKYAGYVAIQQKEVERIRKLDSLRLPADLDYFQVDGLSTEIRQKLSARRPATLGEAARIPGVTPASLNAVSIHLTLKYRKETIPTEKKEGG